jgi:hypothetical protein
VGGQDTTDPNAIIAEIANGPGGLMGYQEKQAQQKALDDILQSIGLTPGDLKTLNPQKLAAVEKEVATALQQRIENSMKDKAAQQQAAGARQVAGANGTALLSAATAGALFEFQ